jgi:heme oxygenase
MDAFSLKLREISEIQPFVAYTGVLRTRAALGAGFLKSHAPHNRAARQLHSHNNRGHRRMSNIVPISRDAPGALHRSLRAATRSDHMDVDRLIGRLDLTHREDYGRLLSVHHAVLQDLESEWRAEDGEDFRAMSRRLQNDLRVLGFPTANPQSLSRDALAPGSQLGIAYVIRSSRLGASVLRPRVPLQFSASYLDFIPTLSWVQFLGQLQGVSKADQVETSSAAIRGAKITYELFSRLLA